MTPQLIQEFLHSEDLPATYGEDMLTWFLPAAQEQLLRLTSTQNKPLFIGINGAQGRQLSLNSSGFAASRQGSKSLFSQLMTFISQKLHERSLLQQCIRC